MPVQYAPFAHSPWPDWLSEPDRAAVKEVLSILGTEGAPQDPGHLLHLFPRLSVLARYVEGFGAARGFPWLDWSESLAKASSILTNRGIQPASIRRRTGNSYLVSIAPLSACFSQPADPKIEGRYLALSALLLAVLATDKSGNKEKFHSIADGLRMSRDTSYPAGRLLAQLPAPKLGSSEFVGQMKSALRILKNSAEAQEVNVRPFVDSLTKLLGILESTTGEWAATGDKPGNKKTRRRRQPTPLRLPVDEPGGESRWRPPGVIAEVDITPTDLDDDYDFLIPPEAPLLIYTEDIDAASAEAAEAISEEGVAARARQTRYWLSRYYNITPVDRSLLNPLERARLAGALRTAMATSAPLDEGLIACAISLSYFLGMDLGQVLRLEFSKKGNLDLAAGLYRKPLLRPESGFVPKEGEYQYYEETPAEIELALPKFVADYLRRLEQARKKSSRTTFDSVIGLDPDACLDEAKRFLESLREHGRYQLYIERIRASLRNDLSAHCRNPVITYLLAGTEDQQAPMLSYYQAIKIEYLRRVYAESCQRLMAEEYQVP